MSSKQKMIIITAPSGSGKTTIARYLLESFTELTFSISATNRPKRDYELNGEHYFFFSDDEFHELIEQDKLAEWEEVYPGRFYGTLKSEINRAWDAGKVLLFDVDVNGALNLKKNYNENVMTIFVQAPSVQVLEERLRKRGSETEKTLNDRIARATYEYSLKDKFDEVLINDKLDDAKEQAHAIVSSYLNN